MNELIGNDVMIVRTPTGIGVATHDEPPFASRVLTIEVYYDGRLLKQVMINSYEAWRDYFHGLDMLRCGIVVKEGNDVVAELPAPNAPLPFMVRQGEQRHITEAYVSVPPALTITDECGDVWTMGFQRAQLESSPRGEFAFNVLRNGIDAGEIASRIERRNGKVRVLTKQGWKIWNGRFFF